MANTQNTAVILTALGVETEAVMRQPGCQLVSKEKVDETVFRIMRFGGWSIVTAEVGAGNNRAATIAQRAFDHYNPTVAIFVGVAGGIKDVAIGDVVVGTKIYGYESGKETDEGFKSRPDVQNCSHSIEQQARDIRIDDGWKKRLSEELTHQNPQIHVGPIAAGEKVVASNFMATAQYIRNHFNDAIAVEMEGRGFLEAAQITNKVSAGIVRGISDLLSDKNQSDGSGSQKIAADAAAAVAFEILSQLEQATKINDNETQFIENSCSYSKAVFFSQNEILASKGKKNVDEMNFLFTGQPDWFLRIIPMIKHTKSLDNSKLLQIASSAPLLLRNQIGALSEINQYGVLAFSFNGRGQIGNNDLLAATQLFSNGEVWCIGKDIITRKNNGLFIPLPYLPYQLFKTTFKTKLKEALDFANSNMLLIFPCYVEAGIMDLKNVSIVMDENTTLGPIRWDKDIIVRRELGIYDRQTVDGFLNDFLGSFLDTYGRNPEEFTP